MIIEEMTHQDLEEVMKIEKENFDEPWPEIAFINDMNKNSGKEVFVLKENNEVIGYYDVWLSLEDADIGSIAVKKEYQGKGLAKPLITYVLHIMKDLGYTNAKLSTQTNSWLAIKIYLDFGFKPYNESLGWGIVKHILKRKELDAYEEISDIFEV